MSARRKRVISTEEIQFNHKPTKMLLTEKKKGVSQNGQTPSIIGICSCCVLDRPVFERCQTLFHPELTPWWSFLLADGAHHKKPHSPTHPNHCFRILIKILIWSYQIGPQSGTVHLSLCWPTIMLYKVTQSHSDGYGPPIVSHYQQWDLSDY